MGCKYQPHPDPPAVTGGITTGSAGAVQVASIRRWLGPRHRVCDHRTEPTPELNTSFLGSTPRGSGREQWRRRRPQGLNVLAPQYLAAATMSQAASSISAVG